MPKTDLRVGYVVIEARFRGYVLYKCRSLIDNSMPYLGANRFCVAQLINIYNGVPGRGASMS